jgi:Protein of unknown function (DUF1376)
MSDERPEPLVPAEVDLHGMSGFMLDVDRLLASELVALGTAEECWHALMLWCRAWQQKPAGSLPNDDRILAAFSGAGSRWRKVKAMAMRGFVLCSDGRYYHPVLAAEVMRAWKKRKEYRADQERLKRWRHNKRNGGGNGDGNDTETGRETRGETPIETPDETHFKTGSRTVETGTGTGTVKRESPLSDGRLGSARANGTANRAKPLPDGFEMPAEWIAEAEQKRREARLQPANSKLEAEQFVAHQRKIAGTSFDWRHSWFSWFMRARPLDDGPQRPRLGPL